MRCCARARCRPIPTRSHPRWRSPPASGPAQDDEGGPVGTTQVVVTGRVADPSLALGPAIERDATGVRARVLRRAAVIFTLDGLAGGSLSACAETYFAQSEQLPTRFAVTYGRSQTPGEASHWRAGGVMLQHMPKASPFVAQGEGTGEGGLLTHADILSGEEGENWTRANLLLDTVEEMELIGPSVPPTDLLVRLFHEEAPRVFDAQPVRFGCSCSEEKVRNSLSIYSAKDIAHMTTAEGVVTADCQFCGAHYVLDPKTVGFDAAKAPDGK